ncbi:Heat Shock Protein GrpE [Chondrus crispus]|uniref:Heat Shock Protein GrpE n=1 Tax=Chondrus crispus TaxID=2769 RepID=R7QJT3_CHOCR|nr:Heat Shock Protein GrpE [Chondrus crispus]CDF38787.1 Heat Shock Protein GrpE [Chondrus crispus]|eukprot:XP_005718692.1 Heat Shock Protein GrpE [Chondrus crispus]
MLRALATRSVSLLPPRARFAAARAQPLRPLATESKADGSADAPAPPNAEPRSDPAAAPPSDEPATPPEPVSAEEHLANQLQEKEQELAALNDRTLRVLAEMENVRMIARRDVDNAKKYAVLPFAKGLLSVADNLGLALKAVPEDALHDPHNHQLQGLYTGVAATEAELLKVFAQHGITRFGEVGDQFDPNKYQAVFEAPSPDHQPGTVMDITKLGYTIGDRILRPAEVGVAKAP